MLAPALLHIDRQRKARLAVDPREQDAPELRDDVGRVRDGPARGLAVFVPKAARLGGERGVVVAHPVEEHQGEKEATSKAASP